VPAPCRKGDIKLAMAGALDTKREVQQVFVIGEGFRSSSACGRSGSPWLAGMMPRTHPAARACEVDLFPACFHVFSARRLTKRSVCSASQRQWQPIRDLRSRCRNHEHRQRNVHATPRICLFMKQKNNDDGHGPAHNKSAMDLASTAISAGPVPKAF